MSENECAEYTYGWRSKPVRGGTSMVRYTITCADTITLIPVAGAEREASPGAYDVTSWLNLIVTAGIKYRTTNSATVFEFKWQSSQTEQTLLIYPKDVEIETPPC